MLPMERWFQTTRESFIMKEYHLLEVAVIAIAVGVDHETGKYHTIEPTWCNYCPGWETKSKVI